jgi:hypothetical protein
MNDIAFINTGDAGMPAHEGLQCAETSRLEIIIERLLLIAGFLFCNSRIFFSPYMRIY